MRLRTVDVIALSPFTGGLLWLAAVSATLVESDTYRYACGILALIGLRSYLRLSPRPAVSWVGWLCMGWACYALAIFLVMFAFVPGHPIGESEFLYCFPFFFPILGVAFSLYWNSMERVVAAFFVTALGVLLATTRFRDIARGETVVPLIQNNQIHGAVCCGILFVGACFWLLHYAMERGSDRRLLALSGFVAPAVMLLSLFCIYGSKSKGVWLAMVLTLPFVAVLVVKWLHIRKGAYLVAVSALAVALGAFAVRANLDRAAGPTVGAVVAMIESAGQDGSVAAAVDDTIGSGSTPLSMDERLQLWWNASELISASPVFGWGNAWLDRWRHARYGSIKYDLMHNGYLEILVRYGAVGAGVFSTILAVFVLIVARARKRLVVPESAFYAYLSILFFFALTLLSNSNNRLAIGESLALVSSAFACACHVRMGTVPGSAAPEAETGMVRSRPSALRPTS